MLIQLTLSNLKPSRQQSKWSPIPCTGQFLQDRINSQSLKDAQRCLFLTKVFGHYFHHIESIFVICTTLAHGILLFLFGFEIRPCWFLLQPLLLWVWPPLLLHWLLFSSHLKSWDWCTREEFTLHYIAYHSVHSVHISSNCTGAHN